MARRDAGSGLMRRPYGRGGGGGQSPYLLDFAQAIFTRASEAAAVDPRNGWAFYDLATPWPGTNVPRILADGAILIDGARTNLAPYSSALSSWTAVNSATVTSAAETAPDGTATAALISDPGDKGSYFQTATLTVGSSTAYVYSAYFKKDEDETRFPALQIQENVGGTGGVTVQINTATGATTDQASSGLTGVSFGTEDAGAYWRMWIRFTTTAAATGLLARVFPAHGTVWDAFAAAATGSTTVWGVQLEAAAFPSSPIRTAGAAATRAGDIPTVAAAAVPTALRTGRQKWTVWPNFSSADNVGAAGGVGYNVFSYSGGASANVRLRFRLDNVNPVSWVHVTDHAGANIVAVTNAEFAKHQKLSITYDPVSGEMTLEGFTVGDGTYPASGTPVAFEGDLRIGRVGAGTEVWHGVIDRPRRA